MTYKPFRIVVLWPAKMRDLSPNGGKHWRTLWKARKMAHAIGLLKTRAWIAANGSVDPDCVLFRWTFHPPTNARRDDDNLVACMKPYRDGICEAIGRDDYYFASARPVIMPKDKQNPRVEIELVNPI